MATVYERVKKLGLARSNAILQYVGGEVASRLYHEAPFAKKLQTEDDGNEYLVNDYNQNFVGTIDLIIEGVLVTPGPRYRRDIRDWWNNYRSQKKTTTEESQKGVFTLKWDWTAPTNSSMYECKHCLQTGTPHTIEDKPAGSTSASSCWGAGIPITNRVCSGCARWDGVIRIGIR